jgi:hypothetical protein
MKEPLQGPVASKVIQLCLFKLLRDPADHLKGLITLVSVLVLFIGINQSKAACLQGSPLFSR